MYAKKRSLTEFRQDIKQELMNNYPLILIDTGILVAFYDRKDKYHQQVVNFFSTCTSQLITTIACVTEVMWLLAPNTKVQNEFLSALSIRVFLCEHLLPSDYQRIQELKAKVYTQVIESPLFLKLPHPNPPRCVGEGTNFSGFPRCFGGIK